ncbi:STT3 [Symbiodinium sp. KB8]|nr:STT3 [Symbiodinium sp. KB8]
MSVMRAIFFALPLAAAEPQSLRGAFDEVACSGNGGLAEHTPSCYGGQFLVEKFSLHVLSYDGSTGIVDMKAEGPQSAECDGAEFQSDDNMITIENDQGCGLGNYEYSVRYCPDQDHVIVNLVKPYNARVVLQSQTCPSAGEVLAASVFWLARIHNWWIAALAFYHVLLAFCVNPMVLPKMALAQRLLRGLLDLVVGVVKALILLGACLWAYRIRLLSVQKYGYLIHEFDPWFNARATKYLAKQGWHAFFHWYDYMSWYPLGRPIGTTIYPGMQILSVWIWRALKVFPSPRSPLKWEIPSSLVESLPAGWISYLPGHGKAEFSSMNVNDVCVMVPAWLAAVATFSIFLLTWEVSESSGAGVAAAVVMAIIPAHLMRSMTGEFDNECVAMAAFCTAFWLWCRSLRAPSSWPWALPAALAYASAVATWGGYIFVNNLIGLHAAVLVGLGKYNSGLYRAYSLWSLDSVWFGPALAG